METRFLCLLLPSCTQYPPSHSSRSSVKSFGREQRLRLLEIHILFGSNIITAPEYLPMQVTHIQHRECNLIPFFFHSHSCLLSVTFNNSSFIHSKHYTYEFWRLTPDNYFLARNTNRLLKVDGLRYSWMRK